MRARVQRVAGTVVVAAVLLALGTLVARWLPGDEDDPGSDPFVRSAVVGDVVDLRSMTVEVSEVRGSARLDQFGTELASPGLWLVVLYSVTADDENAAVGFAQLHDAAGRSWTQLHGRNENTCPPGPPGVPVGCVATFEVPADAVGSLRLRLAPGLEQRYDAVVDVDLGLSDEDAARFASAPTLEVPPSTLAGH